MGVNWASRKNYVKSLSRDSHVTKIPKFKSEKTIAVRAYCDYALGQIFDFSQNSSRFANRTVRLSGVLIFRKILISLPGIVF